MVKIINGQFLGLTFIVVLLGTTRGFSSSGDPTDNNMSKTYRSNTHGFELKFPANWQVRDDGDSYILFEPINVSNEADRIQQSITLDIDTSVGRGTSVGAYVKSKLGSGQEVSGRDFLIGNVPAKECLYLEADDVDGPSAKTKRPIRDFVVIHNDAAYTFEVLGRTNPKTDPVLKQLFKSFRFIKG